MFVCFTLLPLTRARTSGLTPHIHTNHNLQTPQLSIRYTVRYAVYGRARYRYCDLCRFFLKNYFFATKKPQPRTSLTNRGALPADTRRRASATSAQLSHTHAHTSRCAHHPSSVLKLTLAGDGLRHRRHWRCFTHDRLVGTPALR